MGCLSGLVAKSQNFVFTPSYLASWITVREWLEVFWDDEEGVLFFFSEDGLHIYFLLPLTCVSTCLLFMYKTRTLYMGNKQENMMNQVWTKAEDEETWLRCSEDLQAKTAISPPKHG